LVALPPQLPVKWNTFPSFVPPTCKGAERLNPTPQKTKKPPTKPTPWVAPKRQMLQVLPLVRSLVTPVQDPPRGPLPAPYSQKGAASLLADLPGSPPARLRFFSSFVGRFSLVRISRVCAFSLFLSLSVCRKQCYSPRPSLSRVCSVASRARRGEPPFAVYSIGPESRSRP